MTALSQIIADIEAAIAGATPGPWHAGCITNDDSTCNCRSICDEGYAGGIATVHVDNGITLIAEGGNDAPPFEEAKANCAYIAAANPEAVRAILDRVTILETALGTIKDNAEMKRILYDRYGPQWTTPQGNEYEDTSSFLTFAEEIAEIATAAIAGAKEPS